MTRTAFKTSLSPLRAASLLAGAAGAADLRLKPKTPVALSANPPAALG